MVALNAEDGAYETVVPRLLAAGADLARVTTWAHSPGELRLQVPSGLRQLADVLERGGAGPVILDPLLAFLDPWVNIASDPSVRRVLATLSELAVHFRCAFVMLRHLNKMSGGQALYRGLASIAFVAACRIAWLGPDPKVPRRYVLAQAKNNLDPPQLSLSYRIVADRPGAAARIDWLGPCVWSDADLLAATPSRRRVRLRACDFLSSFLRDGPRRYPDICRAAVPLGLHPRTLRRAADDLGIKMNQVDAGSSDHTTCWELPRAQG